MWVGNYRLVQVHGKLYHHDIRMRFHESAALTEWSNPDVDIILAVTHMNIGNFIQVWAENEPLIIKKPDCQRFQELGYIEKLTKFPHSQSVKPDIPQQLLV